MALSLKWTRYYIHEDAKAEWQPVQYDSAQMSVIRQFCQETYEPFTNSCFLPSSFTEHRQGVRHC